uniref:CUE domain-containing protein n=1 Tax=Heterorhabditis bacteriophora TaxID=37862 RepID=A0A1I7X4W1_HETBA
MQEYKIILLTTTIEYLIRAFIAASPFTLLQLSPMIRRMKVAPLGKVLNIPLNLARTVASHTKQHGTLINQYISFWAVMTTNNDEQLLEFNAAMHDFAVMFPTLTPDVIESVLRKNDGDVAQTIDDLLVVSLEKAHMVSSTQKQYKDGSQRESEPVCLPITRHRSMDNSASISRIGKISRTRMSTEEISREKARIEEMKKENERKLDIVCDEGEARILEDEQLALMMQNREFSRCLKREQVGIHPGYCNSSQRPIKFCRKTISLGKEQGPRVPEGPVVDDLILNSEPDLKDKLKNHQKPALFNLLHGFAEARTKP